MNSMISPCLVVLCEQCARHAADYGLSPTETYSVDGCDRCEDKRAGHQVYEEVAR